MGSNKNIEVTIIVPVFNGEKYLNETVKSIQKQTFRNWELLIIDDRSTDGTPRLVRKIAREDTRVKLFRLKENFGGPARPRNVGLSHAMGDFIAFCDADDLWLDNKLERQLAVLRSQKVSVIGGLLKNFSDDKNLLEYSDLEKNHELISKVSLFRFLLNSNIRISSLVIEAKLAQEIGFDESQVALAREDYLFILKAIERSGFGIQMNSVLGGYRLHAGQISGNKFNMLIRHFKVLFSYEFDNKKRIGSLAFFLTISHFCIAWMKHYSKKPF